MERIDEQLEGITFETAREQWLERVARDGEVLRSLEALREHYRENHQRIQESGYPHFEQALKAQPVWVTTAMSAQSIPMQPGLFDLLVIDGATQCTLTDMLPLIFRAKHLVVIGDPELLPSVDSLGAETEGTLAARFGVEEWAERLGHVGNHVYKTAVGVLPRRQADVISLVEEK
jgi:23S rRNA-/tRNA-specific pseudouridylate synthase